MFSTVMEETLARRGTTVAEKALVTPGRQMKSPGGRRNLLVVWLGWDTRSLRLVLRILDFQPNRFRWTIRTYCSKTPAHLRAALLVGALRSSAPILRSLSWSLRHHCVWKLSRFSHMSSRSLHASNYSTSLTLIPTHSQKALEGTKYATSATLALKISIDPLWGQWEKWRRYICLTSTPSSSRSIYTSLMITSITFSSRYHWYQFHALASSWRLSKNLFYKINTLQHFLIKMLRMHKEKAAIPPTWVLARIQHLNMT